MIVSQLSLIRVNSRHVAHRLDQLIRFDDAQDLLVAVQELLDDGEDVVCGDVDGALLCHGGEVVVGLVSLE